jgi:PAS domain S-box-containing protein
MGTDYLKKCLLNYRKLVYDDTTAVDQNNKLSDVAHWKDILFIAFLEYCLPVSFIAAIPGVYMALKDGYTSIAFMDLSCLLALSIATFARRLSLAWRKFIIIILFYILAIFLISSLGYIGPGVFYLLAMTILIALILPINYAYWSVLVNTLILLFFSILIGIKLPGWELANEYKVGQWIAFSSNLVFVGLVMVLLIHKIFDGLQVTIYRKDRLRENYRRIFDNSPNPMWVFDIDTLQFLNVNSAAINLYGYNKTDFLSMTIQDIRPGEYRQEIEEIVYSNKEESKFKKHDVVHLKKGGEVIHVIIESSLLNYKGRQAKLVLATDITAQLKYEQVNYEANLKIKKSEANLQAIFRSTVDGYLLLNETYQIIAFNETAKKSILFNKNNLQFNIDTSIFDYVEESRRKYFADLLDKVRSGVPVEYDRRFVKNSDKTWIHYTVTPVYEDGVGKGVCIIGRDITVYKNYVETIESQNIKLREISWIQSHLVRAPLARIMGLTPLITGTTDEAERAVLLGFLDVSSNDLDAVIREMVLKATEIAKRN